MKRTSRSQRPPSELVSRLNIPSRRTIKLTAPWYIYLITIIIALPVYILWAVGAWGLLRALLSWIFVSEPSPPAPANRISRGG